MARYPDMRDMVDVYAEDAMSLHHMVAAGQVASPNRFLAPARAQANLQQIAQRQGVHQDVAEAGGFDPVGHSVQYDQGQTNDLQARVRGSQALRLGRASGVLTRVVRVR